VQINKIYGGLVDLKDQLKAFHFKNHHHHTEKTSPHHQHDKNNSHRAS
jgi:hypothetical protein